MTTEAQVMGNQVLRSGTSVAVNYREASRARSDAEFLSLMGIFERELDETALWLELLVESGIVAANKMSDLQNEADELIRITVQSIKTCKSKIHTGSDRPVLRPPSSELEPPTQ